MTLDITEQGDRVRFTVRVQPRATRDAIAGVRGGVLRVQLTAPPTDGRANAGLIALPAAALGVSRSSVRLLAGARSRSKIVEVVGVGRIAVDALVAQPEE